MGCILLILTTQSEDHLLMLQLDIKCFILHFIRMQQYVELATMFQILHSQNSPMVATNLIHLIYHQNQ